MRIPLNCTLLGTLFVISACAVAFGQDTNLAAGPQYLAHGSPLFARSLSTPTLTLTGPPLDVGASNATETLVAGASNQTALLQPHADVNLFPIFYGTPQDSIIETPFPTEPSSHPLPASVVDFGVWQFTTLSSLRERGHGMTVPEAAAQGKAKSRHATRVYTNADIDRLHGGS
jgi:hypothetical protein